jgi:3-dehydroquinate synthase
MHNILDIKSKISDYKLGFVDSLETIHALIDQDNTITIIDSNVNELYPVLQRQANIILDSHEDAKTLKGSEILLKALKDRKANIKTTLVVIGGGILQDLVGFCASIYCRGIDYILVPTTLLAQTDSCVGGKTSINLDNRKNLLGTFYPPKEIIIYTKFLETLPNLDYLSGMGEIYKFHILQNNINQFDIENNIEPMILDGLTYKIDILSRDEFDKGERRFLNYGHTFGHALESISNHKIPHGIGVVLGCMIATRIAKKLQHDIQNYSTIIAKGIYLIHKSKLELQREWFNINSLLEIVKSDKKSTGQLTMVLVNHEPFLQNIEDSNIIKEALKEIYESI